MHGNGKISRNAIGAFYQYIKTLDVEELTTLNAYESFKKNFDRFIKRVYCIYEAGIYFCFIALDFMPGESHWNDPVLDNYFSKAARDYYRNSRKRKICIDVYQAMDVKSLEAEQSADEERANRELLLIKSYIEQKQWIDLTSIKTVEIKLTDEITQIIPLTLKPVYEAIINKENTQITAIELLVLIKERLAKRYFAEAMENNVETQALYRSFYTNQHIAFMEHDLHQREPQQDRCSNTRNNII